MLARGGALRYQEIKGRVLDIDDDDWLTSQRYVFASSLEIAMERLRPAGDSARHWTVEGRDSPAGWTREDALKVLNAIGTATVFLPDRLVTRELRPTPARVAPVPLPVQTVIDEVDAVFRSALDTSE